MTNYSVRYLDALGRTQRTEFLPFENNKEAVDFARIGIVANAVVEVWKENDLIDRLYQRHRPVGAENVDVIVQARAALRCAAPMSTKASRDGTMRVADCSLHLISELQVDEHQRLFCRLP